MKIIICSTFTAEPVADGLCYLGQKLNLNINIEFTPYNQPFQQLLDKNSIVSKNNSGVNVFMLRVEDWFQHNSIDSAKEKIYEFMAVFSDAVSTSNIPFVIQLCPISPSNQDYLTELMNTFEEQLLALSTKFTNLYVLGTDQLNYYYPVKNSHNVYAAEEGHIPYTSEAYIAFSMLIFRRLHSLLRPEYKVIVLDCDNTLWRGVCGEVGPQGISVYKKFQEMIQAQRKSGKLLCLCSKNNEEDVLSVFSDNSDMLLGIDDIVSRRINWTLKSENIKSLSNELNLGLDSFVFIDDDPVQCAEVRSRYPQVNTIQFPNTESDIGIFLDHLWLLDLSSAEVEGIDRTTLYKEESKRKQLKTLLPSLSDFIKSLELRVTCYPILDSCYARAAELSIRTNQFNSGGAGHIESELIYMIENKNLQGFVVEVSDRYGDYGMVGLCLYRQDDYELSASHFLLSCRAMGRGVEHAMIAYLGDLALKSELEMVRINYQRTGKNSPALDFLFSLNGVDDGLSIRLPSLIAKDICYESFISSSETSNEKLNLEDNVVERKDNSVIDYEYIALNLFCAEVVFQNMSAAKAKVLPTQKGEYVPPEDDVELALTEIWSKILFLEKVGVTDNFFDIDGNSLMAINMVAEVYSRWGFKIPIKYVFENPTILDFSVLVRDKIKQSHQGVPRQKKLIPTKKIVIDELDGFEV